MYITREKPRRGVAAFTGAAVALVLPLALGLGAAHAAVGDSDGDGMPNRWEKRHGLNPTAADARVDREKDGLTNIAEYRLRSHPRDEDTDGDGHDDGDEVRDGYASTKVLDADSDDDSVVDGDEDADRDGVDNEDEDDSRERCRFDDDDRDEDHVDDEDENELDLNEGDVDTDDDGIEDGDEDSDEDGEANEDGDDDLEDRCGDDSDEDVEDLMGVIVSFDSSTGLLTIDSVSVGWLTFEVTGDTEIEVEGSDEDGSTADLVPGAEVAEVEVDGETGALEEIALLGPGGMDTDEI